MYDLLKKAENERAAYKVIGIEDVETPDTQIAEASGAESLPLDGPPRLSATAGPIALETLLARCSPTTWTPDSKAMLFFGSDEPVGGAEEFRSLRTQLSHLREKQHLRRILVTSSVPKEGRSFVAANLAQAMARQPGSRALLIDADLRSPSLHSALGTPASPGLTEYLLDEAEEFRIIQRGQMANLFFIASGRSVSGQADLVSNGRLKFLLDRLEPIFDWVIIDSPSAIPVTDSSLMTTFCDGVLMVVRANSTPFDIVRKARQRFPHGRLLGVVLNRIPADVDS
jgi:capsular exopolysaccharide synthesis family protein